MNKSAKLATTLLVFFSVATATAHGGGRPIYRPKSTEVKPREGETKEDREKREKEAAEIQARQAQSAEQNYVRYGLKEILGRDSFEIADVLKKKELTVSAPMENQTAQIKVSPMELAKVLVGEYHRNKKQTNEQANADRAKELKIAAEFLALAAKPPLEVDLRGPDGAAKSKDLLLFMRQGSLLPEILNKYSKAERDAHLEVMAKAVQLAKDNGLTADVAFSKALEARYGGKADAKKEEIIKCRGGMPIFF